MTITDLFLNLNTLLLSLIECISILFYMRNNYEQFPIIHIIINLSNADVEVFS